MVRRVLVILVGVLLLPVAATAQTTTTGADLVGTVRDASGGVLPGATVTVVNLDTNATRSTTTDGEGRFRVAALPPGRYRVTTELAAFKPSTRDEIRLMVGQTVESDFSLGLGAQAERVTVTTDAPLVEASRTAISTVVDEDQIDQLPINGRNFVSFSIITPGVTTDRTPQQGASATSGLSFGGQRARSNNIMVDGYDNNDPVVGAIRAVFSQEAVREFQVLTNSYSAEFGRASGGVVNIVTKSGTNQLMGNAFAYFRDDALNAQDHFERFNVFGDPIERDKAPYRQSQWGGTLGGPIRRDRTFFFLSAERLDIDANNFVTISEEARQVFAANGFAIDTGNVPYDSRFTQVLGKVDHEWTANRSLRVRGHVSDVTNENIEPFGGITSRSRGAVQLRRDWSLAASQMDLIGRTWINEARVAYADTDQDVFSLDPSCTGLCDDDFEGGPTIEITGVASVGRQRFTPNPRKGGSFQAADTLTRLGSRHTIKAGLEYALNSTKEGGGSLPLHFGGRFMFAPLPAVPALGINAPLTALQALALGFPAAYVQGYGNPLVDPTYHSFAGFVQDDWRLSNVTIKLGLRYQKQFWPDVAYSAPVPGSTPLAYTFPDDNNNLAPRIAVGWDPRGDSRMVVHGAYGMYFDDHITAINGVTDILDGVSGVRTLVVPFPNSRAAWLAPGRRLPEPTTPYPSLIFTIDPNLETPFAHHFSTGVDHAIGRTLSVSASGIYFRGKHQIGTVDYNPVTLALGASRRPSDVNGVAGTSASVLQYTSYGETWYKGLTLTLTKRLAGNHQFMAAYTLSKAEDNSTDFQSAFIPEYNGQGRDPANPEGLPLGFDPNAERGPANHDQRHRLVLSGYYRLPYAVYVSSILTAASGRPFTPLAGFDWNGDGNGGAFPPDRARRVPGPTGTPATSSVGRNSETMEKQVTLDVRVSKSFPLQGRATVEGIFEVFNLLNRANFSEINNIFGSGAFPDSPQTDSLGRVTYGRYEQALPPRQVQLAVKVTF
jgi:hypothetical protein